MLTTCLFLKNPQMLQKFPRYIKWKLLEIVRKMFWLPSFNYPISSCIWFALSTTPSLLPKLNQRKLNFEYKYNTSSIILVCDCPFVFRLIQLFCLSILYSITVNYRYSGIYCCLTFINPQHYIYFYRYTSLQMSRVELKESK